jgi:calcium-binding protein CML
MGAAVGKSDSQRRGSASGSKLEGKMVEAMQKRAKEGTNLKSFDSIILKFPKIDESLRNCKCIFEQFGEEVTCV